MTQIDHLKVVYEVEDARYRASMNQMRQLSSQTSRDLVRNAEKAESSLKSMRGNIQNFAFQAQDVAVQISAGTSAAQALGQQLPQLLGGFGVLGAVMGAVVAIGIPLAANFLGIGEEAEDLGKSIKELNGALSDYYDAVEAANIPTSELIEKYGTAAGAAQRLLAQLAQIAKLDAASELRNSASAIAQSFEDLPSILALVDAELQNFGEGSSGIETLADSLEEKFGLTIDQARELQAILADQAAASNVQEQADAMLRLAEFLGEANEQANYTNSTLIATNKAAAEGALAANEMAVALEGAAAAAGGVLGTVDQLPGALDAATASAAALARNLAIAIQAAQSLPGTIGAPSLDRFGNGEDITRRAGGMDMQEQQTFRYDWQERLAEAAKAARSGGGRKRKGGGGRKEKEERPFFENVEKDLLNLERQLTLIGKTSEEVATMEARWAMLDEAKRRGVTVNETLNGQIDAQAAKVGQLTAELERAEIAQQQFDEAIEGIADAFAGAITAGESLRDGLAQVFKDIASDILQSGIRQALSSVFNPQGGGNSLLGNIFGGLFGGFRAGGGSVSSGRAYVVGEREPELFVPNVSGTVLNGAQIARAAGSQSAAAQSLHVTAEVLENGGLQIFVQDQAGQVVAKSAPQIVSRSVSASQKSMRKTKGPWGI